MNKSQIRQHFRALRLSLNQNKIAELSIKINQNFIKNIFNKLYLDNSNLVFSVYLAANGEVSCDYLINFFTKNKIKFCYPKISKLNSSLDFIAHEDNLNFKKNSLFPTILEPISNNLITPNILIIPLVSFDKNLSRIGMGGGFYDRTIGELKAKNPELITIGLAYSFQKSNENFNNEKTDQMLDFIVCEQEIFSQS